MKREISLKGVAQLAVTLSRVLPGSKAIDLARKVNGFPSCSDVNTQICSFLKSEFATVGNRLTLGPAVGYHCDKREANLDID